MKYFSIKELTDSSIAKSKNINNIPSKEIEQNIIFLIENILDPIRIKHGNPINVNSGYRSFELNKMIGGSSTSQHMKGEAADITTNNKENNKKLFELIKDSGISFDQLIDEKNYTWIHISSKKTGNRRQVLHLK